VRRTPLADLWLAQAEVTFPEPRPAAPRGFLAEGTRLAAEPLGVPADEDGRTLPAGPAPARHAGEAASAGTKAAGWLAGRRHDARWARRYASPWLYRLIRGISSGDGMTPKRTDLAAL
jgi:hypothetical protein